MTWGFPCQDISIAGKMKGIEEGKTRSGLYYEGYKILKEKLPKYSIIENMKNLTSKRFKVQFDSILRDLSELGYTNYWKVLNAKDYGIPQNRERVFIISIRNDIDDGSFCFPPKVTLMLKLKDLLEENVDEKYYLSEKGIGRLINKNNKVSIQDRIYDSNGIYPTVLASKFRPNIAERKMFNPYNNKIFNSSDKK